MKGYGLHPELSALLDADAPPMHTLSVEAARAGLLRRYGSLPKISVASTRDIVVTNGHGGNLRLRIYRPNDRATAPIVIFFHGGGFVIGSIETHDALCRRLCIGAEMVVVSVDYALAPEHKFPAGIDDCLAAMRWVDAHAGGFGGDRERVALAGDSAGGNLAITCAMHLIEVEGFSISGLLLAYPVTDAPPYDRRRSYIERGQGFGLTAETMIWFFDHYLERPEQAQDPRVAPLRAESLAGLPPTFLITAEFDPLRDEGIELARRLELDDVMLVHLHQNDGNHGFLSWAGTNEPSEQALYLACEWLTATLR